MAVGTGNITLQEVCLEIYGFVAAEQSLNQCFLDANPGGFDPIYEGNKDRLSNFKGYSQCVYKPIPTNLRWVVTQPEAGIYQYELFCDAIGAVYYGFYLDGVQQKVEPRNHWVVGDYDSANAGCWAMTSEPNSGCESALSDCAPAPSPPGTVTPLVASFNGTTDCSYLGPLDSVYALTANLSTLPNNGDTLYTDNTLVTPYNGGNQNRRVALANNQTNAAIFLVSTSGVLSQKNICP